MIYFVSMSELRHRPGGGAAPKPVGVASPGPKAAASASKPKSPRLSTLQTVGTSSPAFVSRRPAALFGGKISVSMPGPPFRASFQRGPLGARVLPQRFCDGASA